MFKWKRTELKRTRLMLFGCIVFDFTPIQQFAWDHIGLFQGKPFQVHNSRNQMESEQSRAPDFRLYGQASTRSIFDGFCDYMTSIQQIIDDRVPPQGTWPCGCGCLKCKGQFPGFVVSSSVFSHFFPVMPCSWEIQTEKGSLNECNVATGNSYAQD